jgi:RNA polymerase sigma-70 factor, ECF subfamily
LRESKGSAVASAEEEELGLVQRCLSGDEAAFRTLYQRHFAAVHHLARRLGTPHGEIEDVTQEVFTYAFRKLDRFEGGSFSNWIHRICVSAVTDHHRRRRVRERFWQFWSTEREAEHLRGPTPESEAATTQAEQRVGQILAAMRPKLREVFALYELEKLSGDEIAQKVGCPPATVRTRLFHARKAFARIGRKRGWIGDSGGER